MKMFYEENQLVDMDYNYPLVRVMPISEKEVHDMMMHEVDAPKAVAELVADRFETESHKQFLTWLICFALVVAMLIGLLIMEHRHADKYEQLYLKTITDEKG